MPARYGAPVLLAAFTLTLRLPSWPVSSFDWDEGMFILGGRELLHGRLPYVALFDIKPPGVFAVFAAAQALLGEHLLAIRALGTALVAITAILVAAVVRRATGSGAAALAAGAALASFCTGLGGLATHTGLLMAPLATTGFLLAFQWRQAEGVHARRAAILAVGLLFGLGITIKPVVALPASTVFLLLTWRWHCARRFRVSEVLLVAALFAGACGAPMGIAALGYLAAGEWGAFWHANFGFMGHYMTNRASAATQARNVLRVAVFLWPLLLVLPLLAALGGRMAAPTRVAATWAVAWLGAELLAAGATRQFFSHYFLTALPPLCVLAGLALAESARRFALPAASRATILAAGLLLCLHPAVPYLASRPWLSLLRPDAPARAAALVRDGAGTWVVNSEPVIYFLAGLPLPTPVPFPPHLLMGQEALSPVEPDGEVARILASQPRYLVLDPTTMSALRPAARNRIEQALSSSYRLHSVLRDGQRHLEIFEFRRQDQHP